jgi:hypothetical protein
MKTTLTVLAALSALSFAAVPARAQFFEEVMTDLGLQSKKDAHIDYTERAPLVLPPSLSALPPPEDANALAAANPQWPKDPDAARRAKEDEEDRLPDQFKRKYSENAAEEIYAINRQEKRVFMSKEGDSKYVSGANRENQVLTREELRAGRKPAKQDPTVFVKEPERKRLTDPPVGYRTPAANQPYADGKDIDPKTGELKKPGLLSKLNPFK